MATEPTEKKSDASPAKKRTIVERQAELYKGLGGVGTIGLEVILAIGLALLGGRWLDDHFHTGFVLTLVCLAFGVAVAVKAVMRVMRLMKREAEEEERREGNPSPLYESASEREERRKRAADADRGKVIDDPSENHP